MHKELPLESPFFSSSVEARAFITIHHQLRSATHDISPLTLLSELMIWFSTYTKSCPLSDFQPFLYIKKHNLLLLDHLTFCTPTRSSSVATVPSNAVLQTSLTLKYCSQITNEVGLLFRPSLAATGLSTVRWIRTVMEESSASIFGVEDTRFSALNAAHSSEKLVRVCHSTNVIKNDRNITQASYKATVSTPF